MRVSIVERSPVDRGTGQVVIHSERAEEIPPEELVGRRVIRVERDARGRVILWLSERDQ